MSILGTLKRLVYGTPGGGRRRRRSKRRRGKKR